MFDNAKANVDQSLHQFLEAIFLLGARLQLSPGLVYTQRNRNTTLPFIVDLSRVFRITLALLSSHIRVFNVCTDGTPLRSHKVKIKPF